MCTFNLTRGECETQIKDTSWSSLLVDRASIDLGLKANKSYDCSTTIAPLSSISLQFFDNLGATISPYRKAYNVLDVLQYIVNYLTNNSITVVSNYLTTNQFAIIYGAELGNVISISRDFMVSFELVFTNLRKLLSLYIKVDGNTLYIGPENDLFGSGTALDITEFPFDTIREVDLARMITQVRIGDTVVPSDSYVSNKPIFRNLWNEAIFGNCTCSFDTNNELDLSPSFIINSDNIFDCIDNGTNKDKIFLIELDIDSNPARFFQIGSPARWYNDAFRNENVLARWDNYLINCVSNTAQNNLFRATGMPWFLGMPFLSVSIRYNDNLIFEVSSCSLLVYYPNIEIDSLSAASQLNQSPVCRSTLTDYTSYTITKNGKYAFSASKLLKWAADRGITNIVDYSLAIAIYSDNTLTTLVEYIATAVIDFPIPDLPLPEPYFLNSISVETGILDLAVNNVVVVEFNYKLKDGFRLSVGLVDGVFEYDAEKLRCEQIINPSDNTLPYRYSFNKSLCNSEFEDLDANKEDIIKLQGEDTYISEVTQDIKGNANFVLISNTPFTKCEHS